MEPSVTPLISCWRKYSMCRCRRPDPRESLSVRLAEASWALQRGREAQGCRSRETACPAKMSTLAGSWPRSEHVVGAVAEGPVVGALAAAQIEGARAFGHEAVRLQAGRLVRAVAEGLLGRAPAACTRNRPSPPRASPGRGPSGRRPARPTCRQPPLRDGLSRPGCRSASTRSTASRDVELELLDDLACRRRRSRRTRTRPGPGTFMKKDR